MNNPFYEVTIRGNKYKFPLMPISDSQSIAIFDSLSSQKLAQDAALDLIDLLKSKIDPANIDYILSAESKGIILAYEIARFFNKEMVIIRKTHKFYHHNPIEVQVNTYTSTAHNLYLDSAINLKDKNILIVDDVLSTGSTLAAIENLLNQVSANIVGKAFVFAEGDSYLREDIMYLQELPLFPK